MARLDFKAIKDHANFETVLTHYGIALTGTGDQRSALCPFHDDRKPSLRVNLLKKLFNCYPCHDGGDILYFVAKKENLGISKDAMPADAWAKAAQKLAEICGIDGAVARAPTQKPQAPPTAPPPSDTPPARTSGGTTEAPKDEPAAHNEPLSFALKIDPDHPYLRERGLSPETIETFGLGGCVSERSMMRQRVLIPIHNERAELIAYAGRWPGNSGWPDGTDKYLLPPKFQKLQVLFNLHRVIAGIHEGLWPHHENHVVIVEGFFSVFRLHALAPAVALMGTTLSPDHVRLMQGMKARFVTLLLDGPGRPESHAAHQAVTAKILHQLASANIFVRAPQLGIGEQPDTINPDFFSQLIALN